MNSKSFFEVKKNINYKFFIFWIGICLLANSFSSFASSTKENLNLENEKQIRAQKLTKVLNVIVSTNPSFSIENLDEKEKIIFLGNQIIEFNKTLQEKGKFSDYISELSENKKWHEILKLTQDQDYIILPEYLREGYLSQQYFNYTRAVSQAYQQLAKKTNILTAEKYYHQNIKICSRFLENIQVFQPDNDKDRICLSLSNNIINADLGESYYRLFMTLVGPEVSTELTSYLWKAASNYNKAILSYKGIRQFDQKEFENFKDFKDVCRTVNDDCKKQLFLCYVGLIIENVDDNLTSEFFKKAKEILSELKHISESYAFCKNSLAVLEKELQAQTLAKGKGRIGPAFRKRLVNKLRKEAAILNAKFLHDETLGSDKHLMVLFTQFLFIRSEPKEALDILKKIEDQVQEKLNLQKENLAEVYKYITNMKPIKFSIDEIIFCFLSNNNIEGALIRAEILQELEQKNEFSPLSSMKVWIAYLKSLQGDYDDWLEIENKLGQVRQEEKKDRKRKQAKNREKHVHHIQENLQKKQKETEQLEENIKIEQQKQIEIRKTTTKIHQSFSIELQKDESVIDKGISDQQRRSEKNQRHQEHLKQREENIREKNEKKRSETVESSHKKSDLDEKSSLDITITPQENNINIPSFLTGLALKVNQEIENDTWKFTKDQLQYYFEVLGCTAHSGKGSHTKISFPKMIHITYENHFITLIGEEGGALTLPRWEDKVPSYLKKQISLARQKIFQLKQKL